MSPEEKSAQYSDLNANQRLLEIQAEIIAVEKRRINETLTEVEHQELKEKIKFFVSEEKSILETRYNKQKEFKDVESEKDLETVQKDKELKQILQEENNQKQKIEGELKEIIKVSQNRVWYERWWGKLLIIVVGAILVSLLNENKIINITSLIIE